MTRPKLSKVAELPKRWVSAQEAAKYLGIGLSTLRQLRDTGELHVYRYSQKITWYDVDSLDRFVMSRRIC